MIRRLLLLACFCLCGLPTPLAAQAFLSLPDAIARARQHNLDARAAALAESEAGHRVDQARAGYFPRVDLAETWQRGDQPVFVFSSLLAQRDFAAENFAIDALNYPAATDNFRLALTVEQALFDPVVGPRAKAAGLGHQMATLDRTRLAQDLAVSVTGAYGRVLAAVAIRGAAAAAVEAAESDLRVARDRRDAGRVTDADVLQVEVHIARARERQIRATADERIARATLNHLLGEPLDSHLALDPAPDAAVTAGEPTALEAEAVASRTDVKLAGLREQLAEASIASAKAGFLPTVAAQGGWEANGGEWTDRASSWVVGVSARINLFQGLADRAKLAESRQLAERRAVERAKAETTARLEVRAASARLDAARAASEVGRAAASQARESRRIIRDRYEAGLVDVTALLRAAEAVTEAEARETASRVDVLTAAAALARALGRL
jgi:outer membrane protein TolC